jgi:hypothetical protein
MADTMYAWSPIRYGGDVKDGQLVKDSVKTVAYGDSVTQDKLKVSDADWEALVEGGVVRKQKPPELAEGFTGSPMDALRAQLTEAGEPLDTTGGTSLMNEIERQEVAAKAQAEIQKAEGASDSK